MITTAALIAHWVFQPLGGKGYQLWSGIGSDISEITLLAGLAVYLARHNCHVRWCWRLQWRRTAAGDVVCRKHHPEDAKTHAQILADHDEAKKKEEHT